MPDGGAGDPHNLNRAIRLMYLAGRVVGHERKLIISLGAGTEALGQIVSARETIRTLDDQPHPGFGLCRQPSDREAITLHATRSGSGLAVVAKPQTGPACRAAASERTMLSISH
jgi:hypothetical protein